MPPADADLAVACGSAGASHSRFRPADFVSIKRAWLCAYGAIPVDVSLVLPHFAFALLSASSFNPSMAGNLKSSDCQHFGFES